MITSSTMLAIIATVFLLGIHQVQGGMNATVILYPPDSEIRVGDLLFTQENAGSPVRITGEVTGLNASSAHGFHIHTNPVAEILPNCSAAGPHFNPYGVTHGPRTGNITSRHVGDLGNLTTNDAGSVQIDMEDYIIQLYNDTQSIVNRSVVVHLLRDDGGEGGFDDSNTTGNAGFRMMCGLVKLQWEDPTTTTTITTITTTITDSTTTASETSTTATDSTTSTSEISSTTSAGWNIQPTMFILLITRLSNYIIHY